MALGSLFSRGGRWRSAFFGDVAVRIFGMATWIPVIMWFNTNVAEITNINGPSMYPFFNEDINSTTTPDKVLNVRWQPYNGLERGMVVTFRSPFNPEVVSVKRVIALEGDQVVKSDPNFGTEIVRVPQGHIWVEGDGPKDKTLDSNTYGPISKMLITGKITGVLYPFRKFGRIRWWENDTWSGRVIRSDLQN